MCACVNEKWVFQENETLTLSITNGDNVILKSTDCEDQAACRKYEYLGLMADQQFYAISVMFYEHYNSVYLISSNSGTITDMLDQPYLSPNEEFFVTAYGSDATDIDNGVRIWEIREGELMKVFEYIPPEYAHYTFIKWLSDSSALISKMGRLKSCSTFGKWPIIVTKKDKWDVREYPEQARCGNF